MAMIKVWYPGPAVDVAEREREQLHLTIGLLRPGWNEVDEDMAMAPLEIGLVTLEAPSEAPEVDVPIPPEVPPSSGTFSDFASQDERDLSERVPERAPVESPRRGRNFFASNDADKE